MTTATKPVTADELFRMGDIGRCELIYGEIVKMSPAGIPHGRTAMQIAGSVHNYVKGHKLGEVYVGELGYELEEDLVLAPDMSFIRQDRLVEQRKEGYALGTPDLALEVISPSDTRRRVLEKVNTWLVHGAGVVWLADPKQKTIEIHRLGQGTLSLGISDALENEPLLPGFRLPLSEIFDAD